MTATEWIEEWLKEFPSDKALVETLRRANMEFRRERTRKSRIFSKVSNPKRI